MNKYLIRALRKLKILRRVSIYPQINIAGVKFQIPIINEIGVTNYLKISEPWMLFLLKKLSNEEKTFVDIGANLGQTLIKVKAVNKSISYIGFEPNPICINYLNELIKVNDLTNIEIYPVGISERSTVLKLNLFSEFEYDSAASIVEDFRNSKMIKKSINVPVFNISDLTINTNIKIGTIKIDVEGAELEVLKNLSEIITSDRPYILIEVLPAYTMENNTRIDRQNKIHDLLEEYKYSIFRVMKYNDKFEAISKMETFDIHADLNLCDYIFSPNEKTDELAISLTNSER